MALGSVRRPARARPRRRRAVAGAAACPPRPLPTRARSPSTPPRGPSPRRSRAGPRDGRAPRPGACGARRRAAARRSSSGPGAGHPDHADRRPASDAGPTARTGRLLTVPIARRRPTTGPAGERHGIPRSCPGGRQPDAPRLQSARRHARTPHRERGRSARPDDHAWTGPGAGVAGCRPRPCQLADRRRARCHSGRGRRSMRRAVGPSSSRPPVAGLRDVRPAEPDRAPAEDPDRGRPSELLRREPDRGRADRGAPDPARRTWARPTAARRA